MVFSGERKGSNIVISLNGAGWRWEVTLIKLTNNIFYVNYKNK